MKTTSHSKASATHIQSHSTLGRWLIVPLLGWSAASALAQAPVFNHQNGRWYAAIPGDITWEQAKIQAESLGGYLATLTSQEENDFVSNTFPSARSGGYHLGGQQAPGQTDPSAGWSWITGEPWQFTNWLPGGEPNDFGGVNEDKLALHGYLQDGNPNGYWNDLQTTGSAQGFVVEFERLIGVPEQGASSFALLTFGCLALIGFRKGTSQNKSEHDTETPLLGGLRAKSETE